MNLSPDFEVPDVYLNSINVGGNLRIGAYQFVFRYLDNSLNPTNWCAPTNPIYITQPTQNNVDMVMNNGGTLNPTVNDGFNYANKSITITIDNLDTRYKYYQLGILESTNGLGTINNSHITGAITMLNTQEEYTLYEISTTRNINPVDSSEITVPNLYINRIAAHAQIENKLLLEVVPPIFATELLTPHPVLKLDTEEPLPSIPFWVKLDVDPLRAISKPSSGKLARFPLALTLITKSV